MPRSDSSEHARYMREVWYPRNRKKQIALVRANERRLQEFVDDEKVRRGGCLRCGFAEHRAALDFHHRDPELKMLSINRAVKQGWGIARLALELAKCDLLCANCHRILHAEERVATLESAGRTNGKSPCS